MTTTNTGPDASRVSARYSLRHVLLAKFWRLRHDAFSFLGQYPILCIPLIRLMIRAGLLRVELLSKRTELLIAGFPRSANSFAANAFKIAQPRPVPIAHHLHAPAHVMLAARKGIPILVLVRRPEDAVLSLVIRVPSLSIKQALEDYIRFYTRIKPYHSRYLVATFDDVTRNFGGVIERVNQRFCTAFSPFEHNEKNVRKVFRLVEQDHLRDTGRSKITEAAVARPSSEREGIKAVLEREFENKDLKDLIARAQSLYRDFTAQSN